MGLILGLAIFYYVVDHHGGLQNIIDNLKKTGWSYLFVIIITFMGIVLFTFGWRQFLPHSDHPMSFLSLLKVRLCGEGISFIVPGGFLAGDPVRMVLLQKYLGPKSQMRSVVADRVMHTLAAHVLNFVGYIFLITQGINFPEVYSWSLVVFYGITTYLIAHFTIDILTGKGLGALDGLLVKLKFSHYFPKAQSKLDDLKNDLIYYKDKPKKAFWISFFIHLIGRTMGIFEIAIISWCLVGKFDLEFSYMLAALISFIAGLTSFVPIGPVEGLAGYFAVANGYPGDIGITIQLIRRLRSFFWVLVGVILIDYKHMGKKIFKNA